MARLSDRVVTGAPNGILANDEPIQWYAADGITLIDGIKVDPTDAVYLAPAGGPTKVGGDLDVTGAATLDGKIIVGNSSGVSLPSASTGIIGAASNAGLILGGSGTTDDVRILNKDLDNVITIPTGTTSVEMSGDLGVDGRITQTVDSGDSIMSVITNSANNSAVLGMTAQSGGAYAMSMSVQGAAIGGKGLSFRKDGFTGTEIMFLDYTNPAAKITGALDVTNAGIATAKISATGTGGANQAVMKFYNEGAFKGQIGYREASDDFEIWSQNGSLPTMTMDVGNNVDIPNGNLGVTGSTNLGAPSNTSGRLNIENAGNAAIQIRSGGSIQMRPTANDFDWRFKQEGSSLNFYQGADLVTPVVEMKQAGVDIDGALDVTGALSKGSGSFRIDHPLKPETHQLVHSFTESPQADLLYSGSSDLVDGAAKINLDEFHGMTEGTFVALNRNIRVFTTNETDWEPIRGSVSGNILTISCRDDACTDKVSWLVIGERQDDHMMDTDWTDEQGRVIVEPRKRVIENA